MSALCGLTSDACEYVTCRAWSEPESAESINAAARERVSHEVECVQILPEAWLACA